MTFVSLKSTIPWIRPAVLTGLCAFASFLPAQESDELPHSATILSREVMDLPPFQDISDRPLIDLYAEEDEYTRARLDPRYAFERLTYLSDGLEVVCYMYRSTHAKGPQPAIVFNRGSYVRNDAPPEYLTTFYRLAQSGYVILAPMYRGSEGAAGRDEMGGADLNDLMRIQAIVDELSSIDPTKLFLFGESRGGMMVLQAIRDGFPANAAAIFGSPTDFFGLFERFPDQYEPLADQLWPNWRTNSDDVLGRRSAVRWAGQIDTPILIMHGGNDQSMPVTQSLRLASHLQELDKTYELHIFGYENHMISGRARERDALAIAWFEKHAND